MSLYQYKPLKENEIRLIELQSWESYPQGLIIEIRHVPLYQASDTFEALSYVWGDSTNMRRLYCSPTTYLMMTTNLWAALHRCRWRSQPRLLWVDAICINQNDLAERGSQVALMRQIYHESKRTVIHLGLEADNSSLAIKFLDDLSERCQKKTEVADKELQANRPQILADPVYENNPDLAEGQLRLEGQRMFQRCAQSLGSTPDELFGTFDQEETKRALVALMARPWFQRAWIIQEFVVAKEAIMYCGNDIAEWSSFLVSFCFAFPKAKINWHSAVNPVLKTDFHHGVAQMVELHSQHLKFKNCEEHVSQWSQRQSLLVLLSRCRRSKATLGVDKMYSLYGISSDFCNVTPDYEKSEEDVYTEFAKNQIKKGNGRRTLYQATIAERRSEELPSWVPDWGSAPTRMNFGEQWSATSRWLFKAGGEQTASGSKETLIVNGRTLITRGYVVQRIATMFQLEDHKVKHRISTIL
jgi:hypothetical protein